MKKTLSLLLVLAMVLSSFGFAFAAKEEVKPAEFLNEKGILKGNASGDLMLEDNLKRQDMIVMLSRLLGVEKEAKAYEGETSFKDVVDPFYVPYVAWAEANELTNGKAEGKFGFDEFVTEQQVAQFMLRALGYGEVAWDDVPAKAAALKLVEKDADLTKDAKRSVLAEITYKALGTKMKDSEKTLAEHLGIEMPAPKELKVEKVYTENLREVVVELSNAKLAEEKLTDANNYKIAGYKVEKATIEDNSVILLLNEGLSKGKKYEVVVRNIDRAINKTYKFTAEDNTIPSIEKVDVLGEYGIKVTTSEPIKNPLERSFLIDGKNVAMDVEQYGRILILTPYYDKPFPENAKTLTVKPLADYVGFKSVEEDFEIEMVKDEVAPEVKDVVIKGNVVEVTFDKDIYIDSVVGYLNRKTTGNVTYKDGRQTIYSEYNAGEKIDINKAKYTFDREIPRRAELTIEGITNHSDVEMKAVTTEGRIVTDYTEPALIDSKKNTYVREKDEKGNYVEGKAGLTIELYFDKDVSGRFLNPDEKDAEKLKFDADYHFDIYLDDVLRGKSVVKKDEKVSDYITSAKYGLDKNGKVRKDLVVLKVTGLNVNNKNKDFEYVLEVKDFTDVTSFKNRMYRDYVDFNIPRESPAFKVEKLTVKEVGDDAEIKINFNLPVDRVKAENLSNYLFRKGSTTKDLEELKGNATVVESGFTVLLEIPDFNPSKYDTLEVLETLKDAWYDGRLTGDRVYDFKAGKLLPAPETKPVEETSSITYNDGTADLTKDVVDVDKAVSGTYDLTVKVKGQKDNDLVVEVRKDGVIQTGSDLTTGLINISTDPFATTADIVKLPITSRATYEVTAKVYKDSKVVEEQVLVVNVKDTDANNTVKYKTIGAGIALTKGAFANYTEIVVPFDVKLADLKVEDFKTVDKAGQTVNVELRENNTLLHVTVTPEKGNAVTYILSVVNAELDDTVANTFTDEAASGTVVKVTVVDELGEAVTSLNKDNFAITGTPNLLTVTNSGNVYTLTLDAAVTATTKAVSITGEVITVTVTP